MHLVCNETRAGSSPAGSTTRAWRKWKTRWAQSASGSAPRLRREACRFEPGWVHHAGVAELEDAPDSDSGGREPVRVRASPPAPGAPLAQLVERWTLNPCRRGFEPLEAHPTGIIRSFAPGCSSFWTEHPVRNRGVSGSSPLNQTSGEFTPHHSGVVQWHGHSALNRETVVRIHLPEHRRGPVNA